MKYIVYLLLLANVIYLGWNIHLYQTAGEAVRELPPLPAGVTPLVTLQELEKQQEQTDETSRVDALTDSKPPGAGIALACKSIGPFLVEEELQAVAKQLGQQGLEVKRRTAEVQKPNGFWVYLPAMEREQVLQAVNKLEENRDREYYVGKGNFLALGTFKEISRAEIRLEETRKLGFDPILEARYETTTEYWLDIDTRLPAADVLDAILQDHPGLKLQDAACP
jgi:hypothetical protein